MIELDDKIVGLWFLYTTEKQDWMLGVRELEPDQKYELIYRFRNYKDDKYFDSEDEKNWYGGTTTSTRNYMILSARSMGEQLLAAGAIGSLYEFLNDKGLKAFLEELANAPFAFMRQVPAEEVYGKDKSGTDSGGL
jgi:hypothetical protein